MITQGDIDSIIQSGEGYTIEFKRNVNSDLAKELVAFANSSGGRVFLGIEDNGNVSGVTITNDLKSQVQVIARDCDPSIPITTETFNNILIVQVSEGQNKPYRCTNGFYVRNGPNSEKLTTEQIAEFFQEHLRINYDETPCATVKYPDGLDEFAIKKFMMLLSLTAPVLPDQLMKNLGVVKDQNAKVIVNNAGVLFFAQSPSTHIPQSIVTCVAYRGNNKVEIVDKKSFEFHITENIDEAINFLKRHLNVAFEIKTNQRTEKIEIPEVVLREAVVNAVAHRDYFQSGATVMIEVFANRVEISNPGGLPKGFNPDDLGRRTLARNPLIASLLNRVRYIEKLGTGIQRMREEMEKAGLPKPTLEYNSFFTVTLKRNNFEKMISEELEVNEKRSERLAFIIRALAGETGLNLEEAAENLGTTSRTLRNDLELLEESKWIKGSGSTKGRSYNLTEIGKQKLIYD